MNALLILVAIGFFLLAAFGDWAEKKRDEAERNTRNIWGIFSSLPWVLVWGICFFAMIGWVFVAFVVIGRAP